MGIFSPVDQASQASYKILVQLSQLRLHGESFSPGCRAETSARFELPEMRFSAKFGRAEIPHVIDKKFQPGLKIHKRVCTTINI